MRKTTECVVPPTTAHRNRLSEQTVKTESRRTSALIGFDTNLKRQIAAARALLSERGASQEFNLGSAKTPRAGRTRAPKFTHPQLYTAQVSL